MTWRDDASVRIKLKVSATQRHHSERAERSGWLAGYFRSSVSLWTGLVRKVVRMVLAISCAEYKKLYRTEILLTFLNTTKIDNFGTFEILSGI